jgi:serine/threonine-protein kinase
MHELTGATVAHFEIGPLLGRGQSGLVFRARDTEDGNTVALKVLWPEFAEDEEEVQRFVRAMKTMMPLKHPHLITIYTAGKTGPYCWVAMELVEGESVTKVLQMLSQAGTVDWKPALRVAIHVARGLVFAHHHRIIHRNIAPQNIPVRASDQTVKLGDLMLAKALEGSKARQVTRPGELLGDVRFMAPERTYGDGREDLRADLYSLGATVYAMLTGKVPHEGSHPVETLTKVRNEEPVRPRTHRPNLPELVEATVLKMLAKRPEARHQTAIELLADLDRIAKLQGVAV